MTRWYGAIVPSPTPQSDRRRAVRAVATFPVRFQSSKDRPDLQPALLRDISEIGLACTSPQKFAEMTMVGLDFSLPGATEVHHVEGAVVRCEPLGGADKGSYDLAIFFTQITPVTRAALRNYVGKAARAR